MIYQSVDLREQPGRYGLERLIVNGFNRALIPSVEASSNSEFFHQDVVELHVHEVCADTNRL